MKAYSDSAVAAILKALTPELFLLGHRSFLVELDPHRGTALGRFALLLESESIGLDASDESWLRGSSVTPEWLERTRV